MKKFMELKHTDFQVKKKFCMQLSIKKVMLTEFWDIKRPITIHFLEKSAIVNNISYCQLIRQNLSIQ